MLPKRREGEETVMRRRAIGWPTDGHVSADKAGDGPGAGGRAAPVAPGDAGAGLGAGQWRAKRQKGGKRLGGQFNWSHTEPPFRLPGIILTSP